MRTAFTAAIALASLAALPASALGQAQTFGSPLTAEPNLGEFIRCENRPFLDASTGQRFLGASGAPDCTWRQQGVQSNINDPRHSSVPGDGRIIGVEVRAGNTPAPLTFVVMAHLVQGTTSSSCCSFINETQTAFQPQPNTRTAFPLDLPVQRNTQGDIRRFDIVGLSAQSGAGTLPLHSTGANNAFDYNAPGSVNAGNFYPRVSAADGAPRYEDGMAGVEVLARWTWCPAGQTCGATGGDPGGNPGGGTPGGGTGGPAPAPAPVVDSRTARAAGGRAAVDLICQATNACTGVVEILRRAGAPIRSFYRAASYGEATYDIPAGGEGQVKVKLSRKAKKALKQKGKLKADLSITPTGGTASVTPLTIKPK
jgi:hypothetical protein